LDADSPKEPAPMPWMKRLVPFALCLHEGGVVVRDEITKR
jgi:hypothetical protein